MEKRFLFVCQNLDCRLRKSAELMERLKNALQEEASLEVRPYLCFGACHDGPHVVVYPDKVWFARMRPEEIDPVLAYLRDGQRSERFDTVSREVKEMIFRLLDAGMY